MPYTIHHIPYTIHHTPYSIYHIPYTIYHIPYTMNRLGVKRPGLPMHALCSAIRRTDLETSLPSMWLPSLQPL
ncbi:hypothetical protein EON63_14255 [archaeon]|nr:MAG: hypothetical protein EON63_14255 [archaeon]